MREAKGLATVLIVLLASALWAACGGSKDEQTVSARGSGAAIPAGVEVLRVRTGYGADEVGAVEPQEANPEGPMSFAVSPDGELYILDQLNARLQIFRDGKRVRSVPIPGQTFVDIELIGGERILLLDNLVKKSLVVLDRRGGTIRTVPLEGQGVGEAAEVIALEARAEGPWKGIWVMAEERWIRIATDDGAADPSRLVLVGRPSFDGKRLLRAELRGEAAVSVLSTAHLEAASWDRTEIAFERPVLQVLGLWDGPKGSVFVGVRLDAGGSEADIVVRLSPDGREIGRVPLASSMAPHEIFRPVRVLPDGRIYQMMLEGGHLVVRMYDGASPDDGRLPAILPDEAENERFS